MKLILIVFVLINFQIIFLYSIFIRLYRTILFSKLYLVKQQNPLRLVIKVRAKLFPNYALY